ncbi:hypothetical protein ACFWBX_36980 [Streptomyces sp. NPDC059991]|uniref:hypothetical protein n=1 Tax=Streptomyces sp. NPDC059991 TaxID=3347028 RepID=UPI0036A57CB6
MKRTSRALAGMAAVAVLAGIPATAQAAPVSGKAEAAEWTLHFDGMSGTPSPADAYSHWSGTCPVPNDYFDVDVSGNALHGFLSLVPCTSEGTYRFALLHYGYNTRDVQVEKGQKYTGTFAPKHHPEKTGRATAVIE